VSTWDQFSEYLRRSLWWKKLEEEVCFKSGVKRGRNDSWWEWWTLVVWNGTLTLTVIAASTLMLGCRLSLPLLRVTVNSNNITYCYRYVNVLVTHCVIHTYMAEATSYRQTLRSSVRHGFKLFRPESLKLILHVLPLMAWYNHCWHFYVKLPCWSCLKKLWWIKW